MTQLIETRAPLEASSPHDALGFVISSEHERLERTTRWAEHSHPVHELMWTERGVLSVTVGRSSWTVAGTKGIWIPSSVPHSAEATAGTLYRAVFFSTREAPRLAEAPVAVETNPLLRELLRHLAGDLDDGERSRAEAVVFDVLQPSERGLIVSIPDDAIAGVVATAVIRRPDDTRSLEAWARELGVSARTVTRAFQASTGMGFSRWVASARIRHAIGLLADGRDVESVAIEVGYTTTAAFGAAFRRITGLSPRRFHANF